MEHEEAMGGKEDVEAENAAVSAAIPPPTLNFRRLESIQRLLQYGSVLILFVFITLIVFSYFQWHKTIEEIKLNEDKIVKQTSELNQQKGTLIQQDDKLRQQNEMLIKQEETVKLNEEKIKSQNETLKEKNNFISAVQKATLSYTEENPGKGEQLKQTIENNIAQGTNSKSIPARIYFQIAREDQRKRAADIARQLQSKGFIVPGIENVRAKAPNISELRACSSNNTAQQDIIDITNALKSLSVGLEPKILGNCSNVRPRHYEIWFGDNF